MNRMLIIPTVALLLLAIALAACGGAPAEPDLAELSGPAFILFYTDN